MGEFITDVFLVTGRDNDLSTFILDATVKGHDGNLWDNTWTNKGKRFLGYKKNENDQYIVTDLWAGSEDKDVPDGYAGILITKDSKEKGLRKHLLAYHRELRKPGLKAITDICIINPSKGEQVPPFFTTVGQSVNEKKVVFKMEEIKPVAPSRQGPAIARDTKPIPKKEISMGSPTGGIDGIPFQINPKFDAKSLVNDPIVAGISILSADDILKKYNYSFEKEKTAVETL